jgi:hypothetical protein
MIQQSPSSRAHHKVNRFKWEFAHDGRGNRCTSTTWNPAGGHKFDELAATLGEELLRPTDIYVRDAMEILQKIAGVKALINITSDGLLNLTRVGRPGRLRDRPADRASPDFSSIISRTLVTRSPRRRQDAASVVAQHRVTIFRERWRCPGWR